MSEIISDLVQSRSDHLN